LSGFDAIEAIRLIRSFRLFSQDHAAAVMGDGAAIAFRSVILISNWSQSIHQSVVNR
jgi:hypothetical protein